MRRSNRLFGMTIAVAVMSLIFVSQAFSLASSPVRDDQPSPVYMQKLPAEVRTSLQRYRKACGDEMTATSGLGRFIDVRGVRLITLHLHELRCSERLMFCNNGKCLHQIYMSNGGRFHLVMSVRANEVTLRNIDNVPAIEIECGFGLQRTWRWNGKRFTGR